MTINSKNVNEISEMYKLAQKLEVKSINYGKIHIEGEHQQYLKPKPVAIFLNISKLSDIYEHKIKLNIACLKVPDYLKFPYGRELMNEKLKDNSNVSCSLHCKNIINKQ